jgi:16S rRNA (cytidine1402-2'-O)-methyltransferase
VAALAGQEVRGEVVLLIDRAEAKLADGDALDAALHAALASMPVSAAAAEVAQHLGLPRRQVYQRALALSAEE